MNPGPLGPRPTMITTRPPPGRTGCYVLKFRFLCLLIPDDLKKSESFFVLLMVLLQHHMLQLNCQG